jgi:hypothetical protein
MQCHLSDDHPELSEGNCSTPPPQTVDITITGIDTSIADETWLELANKKIVYIIDNICINFKNYVLIVILTSRINYVLVFILAQHYHVCMLCCEINF